MSSIAALTTPSQNTKPGFTIYVDSVDANNCNTNNLEVKNDVKIDGHINVIPSQIISGSLALSLFPPEEVKIPGKSFNVSYSFFQDRIVCSGDNLDTTPSYSSDGVNFTSFTAPTTNQIIGWLPNIAQWVCLNYSSTDVYTSSDLTTWFARPPSPQPFNGGGGLFHSNNYNRLYYSSNAPSSGLTYTEDANTWVNCNLPDVELYITEAPPSSGLGTGTGRMICTTSSGIYYSDDGKNFTLASGNSLQGVTWSNTWKMFLGVTNNPVASSFVFYSYDGINWEINYGVLPSGVPAWSVLWIEDLQLFVVGGDNYIAISSDGFSWRKLNITGIPLNLLVANYISQWGMLTFSYGGLSSIFSTQKIFSKI